MMELPGLDPLPAVAGDHAHAETGASAPRVDPHAWLDPIRVRDVVVPALAAQLIELDPDGRAEYEALRDAFVARLTALDGEIRATLAGHGRRFLAFHAGWRYFAQRYQLDEVGVIEEAPGEEPTPRELAALSRRASRRATARDPGRAAALAAHRGDAGARPRCRADHRRPERRSGRSRTRDLRGLDALECPRLRAGARRSGAMSERPGSDEVVVRFEGVSVDVHGRHVLEGSR